MWTIMILIVVASFCVAWLVCGRVAVIKTYLLQSQRSWVQLWKKPKRCCMKCWTTSLANQVNKYYHAVYDGVKCYELADKGTPEIVIFVSLSEASSSLLKSPCNPHLHCLIPTSRGDVLPI